ncbi:histidine kinase [Paenibacillus hamazuiensis]|uniref:histidine kinase n=1 Tax=Paenibacillus hamazuiensis TaxID=2936508 RepID=UPI00200DD848|nr:histidine kinase [Paenibacillus hamazuiensis]
MDNFRRKTPEEIFHSISRLRRGTLKIYIGPVSGSGKTYHMLRDGNALKQRGIDVVICAVSTLQRPETVEQLGDLERVPSIHWRQGEAEFKDLNLDVLLERNPEVVLADGLAHRNRPGARFPTRLDDIKFLLANGISVITTVNVYELEGYTEIARKLTGIDVKNTVPADTLELADEVRLIDVTPEAILSRLAEGHFKVNKDLSLFRRGNLGVLRELALRLVAGEVNESLEEHREEMGLVGPSGASERILVSTQYHWNGSIYIRRGEQIAKRLNGDLRVVTFRNFKRPLSKEAAAFRRSMIKLAGKIGCGLEELPFRGRRSIPDALVKYASQHNVTRIVMGHTKHSRWQELRQGSIVNRLLRKMRNIDLFLIADRAEHDGERILPAILTPNREFEKYRRLSEEEVAEKIHKIKRGKFKIYIGAAPGVGKTYTMLREGNDLLKKGVDVRIGLLETHNRKETTAQIGSLGIIPRQIIPYRGVGLEEMDTAAIVRSCSEVVLIDELAHTNVPGSKNRKRYEDVMEILDSGINVIATVNVQHLESLNDAVEQITGIRVRETVPDSILRMADEVQLIDVSPEALRQRMREGKIYAKSKIDQALNHFFKTGNLIALRELALREIADDVDERLESLERKSSLRGPWRRKELIFVCVNLTPCAERLIRRGFRTAYRLKAAWYVNYVHIGGPPTAELQKRLESLETLTARLGGTFVVHKGAHIRQIAGILSGKADEAGATQLVIGQSKQNLRNKLRQGSLVNRLIRLSRHRDVLVVADYDPNLAL